MAEALFDPQALAARRARALSTGPRLFLAERILEDIGERLGDVRQRFGRGLLVGCPDPALAAPLGGAAEQLLLAPDLDQLARFPQGSLDLLVILGELDTQSDLPGTLQVIRHWLAPEALLIGAFPGNDNLPALRAAMLEADRAAGAGVSARFHPRIAAAGFAGLLQDAGFDLPVVDVDRVRLRYRRFDDLVADLRGMGATNALADRSRIPLTRAALGAARLAFAELDSGDGTVETVELVHYSAWTPPPANVA